MPSKDKAKISADAEIAALYYRTLIANAVRSNVAGSLTTSYVRAVTMASTAGAEQFKAEKVIEHAETTAIYLTALIDKGVPRYEATSFASEYIQSFIFTDLPKPREPWERGEEPPPA